MHDLLVTLFLRNKCKNQFLYQISKILDYICIGHNPSHTALMTIIIICHFSVLLTKNINHYYLFCHFIYFFYLKSMTENRLRYQMMFFLICKNIIDPLALSALTAPSAYTSHAKSVCVMLQPITNKTG